MIKLTFSDGGLAVQLEQMPQIMATVFQQWMTEVLQRLHAAVNRNMGPGPGEGLVGVRTGAMRRALTELVTVLPNGILGELFVDADKVPYGDIQEDGGTIFPRNGQYLTIPLDAMLTGNGVARATARQVGDSPEAFGFSGTFVPKGHSVIMATLAGTHTAIPIFALVTSVTIPAKRYLATTITQEWAWIADRLEQLTGEAVNVMFANAEAQA
jgi:hypothetical protein